MKSLTKNQIKIVQIIFDALVLVKVKADEATENDFVQAIKDNGNKVPWKVLNEYKQSNGVFDFSELFQKALGKTKKSAVESLLTIDHAIEDDKDVIPPVDFNSEKDLDESNINTREENASTPDVISAQSKDYVYVVESMDATNETRVVGVTKRFDRVWKKLVYKAIHDNGTISESAARRTVESKGAVHFCSAHSNNLWCIITKMELV